MADRRNKTLRDMSLSMGLIVVAVLVVVGLYGGFSFSPGAPSGGRVVAADVQAGFATADRAVGFTVVRPAGIPADWQPNSFSLTGPGPAGGPPATVRGGWITADGRFVTLIESSGSVADVLAAEVGVAGLPIGTVQAGGASWSIRSGRRTEQAWTRQAGGVTFLITGAAGRDAFLRVAASIAGG